ncbi:uncharacterized protein RCH25_048699 [Pelodytes ibericus]
MDSDSSVRSNRSLSEFKGSKGKKAAGSSKGKSPARTRCEACDKRALEGKRLCSDCLQAAGGPPAAAPDLMQIIQQAVSQGIREAGGAHKRPRYPDPPDYFQYDSSDESMEEAYGERSSTSEEERQHAPDTLDPAQVDHLISRVRRSLNMREPSREEPSTSSRYFSDLRRKRVTFPVHEAIQGVIMEEWSRTERKFPNQGRISRLYPFEKEDAGHWASAPKVDAAVVRLAKRTTLPVDNAGSLRDSMDRKMDSSLSRAYVAAGTGLHPAVALTSVSRALKSWLEKLEEDIREGRSRSSLMSSLQDIKLAVDFTTEASVDMVKAVARCMAFSVSAKRALWLRSWSADASSKNSLCSLPFHGDMLFGKNLDECIKRAADGKNAFLPQDRRPRRSFRYKRPSDHSSFRDFKSYRPGREYGRSQPWRGGQSSTRGGRSRGSAFNKSPRTL